MSDKISRKLELFTAYNIYSSKIHLIAPLEKFSLTSLYSLFIHNNARVGKFVQILIENFRNVTAFKSESK